MHVKYNVCQSFYLWPATYTRKSPACSYTTQKKSDESPSMFSECRIARVSTGSWLLVMDMRTSIQNDSRMRVVWYVGAGVKWDSLRWPLTTEAGHRDTCRETCVPLNMEGQCNYNEQLWRLAQHIYRATHEGHAEYSSSDQERTSTTKRQKNLAYFVD